MRTLTLRLASIVLLVDSVPTLAASPECRTRPELVAACFTVKGDLQLANGTPSARIHDIRHRRTLGVVPYFENDNETFAAPAAVRSRVSFDRPVRGTYLVCPLEKARAGRMQSVCIERATFTRLRRR